MADVYLAVSKGMARFNKLVVLKCLRRRLLEEEPSGDASRTDQKNEFLAMFLDEARLAARLNHPNIVQTNEVGEDGEPLLHRDGVPRGPAAQPDRRTRLGARTGASRWRCTLRILVDALAGPALRARARRLRRHAARGRAPRRRRPHNIFVTYDGQVKVVDFGIAKAAAARRRRRAPACSRARSRTWRPSRRCGEQRRSPRRLFAVGVMLWEALAGPAAVEDKGPRRSVLPRVVEPVTSPIRGRAGGGMRNTVRS